MKIIVFSDSHKNIANMMDIVNICKVDTSLIVHLGDMTSDFKRLKCSFPDIPYICVKGNNDFFDCDIENECIYNLEGLKFFFTHGHHYGVKFGVEGILEKASDICADIVLFGHTHSPLCEKHGEVVLFNPGSIGQSSFPTFGIIQVKDSKIMSADLMSFDPIYKKIDFLRK